MNTPYWRRQTSDDKLFPDIEWSKPEQKIHAGKLAIIGGNKLGFRAVADSYDDATRLGVGQVRVVLPDTLKQALPVTIIDAVYLPSNPSGGMSKQGSPILAAASAWADHLLLIGDTGRNSETAMLLEETLAGDTPLTITRDAFDLLKNISARLVERERTTLVISLAQLQKLLQLVYYPRIISFGMTLQALVETLHKFTITYPAIIVTYHQDRLVIAHSGEVVSSDFNQPALIWRGSVATRITCYQLWTPGRPFDAAVAAAAA